MRIRHLLMPMIFLLSFLVSTNCAESTFGTWKAITNRSRFSGGSAPKNLTVRIERHSNGEVFTLDKVESDGRGISSSTTLYLDGAPREFQNFDCSGTQSPRRLDTRTVEIVPKCADRDGTWLVRHSTDQSKLRQVLTRNASRAEVLIYERQEEVCNCLAWSS
jgi:hypothetical protein